MAALLPSFSAVCRFIAERQFYADKIYLLRDEEPNRMETIKE